MHPLSRTLIRRSPTWLRRPVALVVRTADAAVADRLPGLAAEVAFWVLLSLPALIVSAVAAITALDLDGQDWQDQAIERVVEVSSVALTDRTIDNTVRPVLEALFADSSVGLASFAFVAAIWTASRAVKVVLSTVAIVFGRAGMRKAWQERLLGFAVTLGALVVSAVLAPLLLAGPAFGEQLNAWLPQDLQVLEDVWRAAYWQTVILAATLALAVLYHLGVPGRSRWRRDLPGAVVATGVWLAGSAGLRLYATYIVGSESPYGPLAGPIVGLLWLWLTGFAVLLGAELNAQITLLWPHRDDREASDELAAMIEEATGELEAVGAPTSPAADPAPDDQADRAAQPPLPLRTSSGRTRGRRS